MRCRWIASLILLTATAPAFAADEWKFDVVPLKNGSSFEGLIADEDRETIQFKYVVRKPGRPTVILDIMISKEEVELKKMQRLGEEDRKELAKRIELLDQGGKREQARMKDLKLEEIKFGQGKGWKHAGKFFEIESNVREDLLRQIIVRLEDVYQAYGERLKAKRQPKELTRITLYRSGEEYLKAIQDLKVNILNPAFYDPKTNRIMAASALDTQAEELDKLRKKHDGILKDADEQEKKVRKHYHGQPPQAMIAQLWLIRRNILAVNAENADAFEQMKQPLLAMLYHEAFHAYLDNYVYPLSDMTVPRWLNEGLAQVFETAIVEGGQLRIGHVHLQRLEKIQESLKKKQLVPLKELLQSGAKPFSVHDLSDKQVADRYFLTSWALAYYLTFDRKMLGTEMLDAYVKALSRGTDPLEAFRDLIDQPLADFEGQFHQFLAKLKPDGKAAVMK